MATSQQEILRLLEEQRKAKQRMQSAMDAAPSGAIEPFVDNLASDISGIGSQIVQGNPALRAITDTVRNIYRGYDFELQGGLPQIVPSRDREVVDIPPTVVEAEAVPPLFDWAPDYVPAGLTDASAEELGGLLGSQGLGGYSQLPGSGAPASVVTARPEMISVDGEYQPASRQDAMIGILGNVMEGMPTVSGRGFKTEGKVKEEAEEKEAARIWGNFAYDPAEAQKRYEDAMQDIYFKSTILDGIAALTGGKSQASSFVEIATKRMEMEEAFRDQNRLQNIQRGIYYTEDGLYDPPKDAREAFDRAMKFGASAELASKVSGYAPEEDTRAYYNWYRIVDGKLEETVARTGDKPEGEGWKKGTYSAPSSSGGTETERTLNMIDSLVSQGNVKAAIEELKRIFTYKTAGDITSNEKVRIRDAVEIVWNSINPSLKIAVPAEVDSVDKLQKWEDELKASGVRGYYRVGNDIGIIE